MNNNTCSSIAEAIDRIDIARQLFHAGIQRDVAFEIAGITDGPVYVDSHAGLSDDDTTQYTNITQVYTEPLAIVTHCQYCRSGLTDNKCIDGCGGEQG